MFIVYGIIVLMKKEIITESDNIIEKYIWDVLRL